MKTECFWIPESQDPSEHGGYVPSLVRRNEAGHYPMLGKGPCARPWVWGKTLSEAREVCADANAKRGVSPQEADEIVMSSMFATA